MNSNQHFLYFEQFFFAVSQVLIIKLKNNKVTIRDENDNAPDIIINTLSQASAVSANVTENFNAGTFVGHVKGSDLDSGKNGKFDCHLEGADTVYGADIEETTHNKTSYFRLKRMFSKEYNVITAIPIDREVLTKKESNEDIYFRLLVACADHGFPSRTAKKELLVYVNDVNDNSPIMMQSSYHFKVLENHSIKGIIGVVRATDLDAGDNARISYSIDHLQYHYQKPFEGIGFHLT